MGMNGEWFSPGCPPRSICLRTPLINLDNWLRAWHALPAWTFPFFPLLLFDVTRLHRSFTFFKQRFLARRLGTRLIAPANGRSSNFSYFYIYRILILGWYRYTDSTDRVEDNLTRKKTTVFLLLQTILIFLWSKRETKNSITYGTIL